jgi:AraC family transcriptional regulator
MNFKVIEKDIFSVFGVSVDFNPAENNGAIAKLWSECFTDGTAERMSDIAGFETGKEQYGAICYDYNPRTGGFRYMITAPKPDKEIPDTFECLEVPKYTWGVFSDTYSDHEDIHILWEQYNDYLKNTEYHCILGPQMEQYYRANNGTLCEVWVPIEKNGN